MGTTLWSSILRQVVKSNCSSHSIAQNDCLRLFNTSSNTFKKILPSNLKGRKTSSQMWLTRQLNDPYVKEARIRQYRCRSAFKLIEIDDKYKFLKPGCRVVDCGAAPGSWSQVAVERVNALGQDRGRKGSVISIDLQHMAPIEGATVLHQMDFTSKATQDKITEVLPGRFKKVDVVISDMAPNACGVKSLDGELITQLCLSVLDFSQTVLKRGGIMLCKMWQGNGQFVVDKKMKEYFETVRVIKPHASRAESAEIFLLGRNFKAKKVPDVNHKDNPNHANVPS